MKYTCLYQFLKLFYLPKLDKMVAEDFHFENVMVLNHSGFELKKIEMFWDTRVHCNFVKSTFHC